MKAKTDKKLLIILGSAFLLRLINLNQSLWLDEAITAVALKTNSFAQLITQFAPGDFHPPFYYLFMKWWSNFFGYSEIALRFPSVIFGVLAIYFIYKIGGKKAAILMALNPLAVYYSQEARMYSLEMMLVTASAWFFLKKYKKLFVLAFAAVLYTDYTAWLVAPIFFSRELIISFLFVIPWLPSLIGQLQLGMSASSGAWGDALGRANFKNIALVPAKFIFGRISLPQWVYAWFVLGYSWFLLKSKNKLYWAWLIIPLFLGFVISIKIPILTYFRFLFVLPTFILLLSQNSKRVILAISAVSLVSLVYFNSSPNLWREDWRTAVAYINSNPGIIKMPNMAQSAPLEYYKVKTRVDGPIYLFRYVQEIFDPTDTQRKNIENIGYQKVEERAFNGVLIWKYVL